MGAYSFCDYAHRKQGRTIKEAFAQTRDEAALEHGHGGYTGTIAEKHDFVLIQRDALPYDEASALAERLLTSGDRRVADKWGPAGAIPVKGGGKYRWFQGGLSTDPNTGEHVEDYDGWLFFGYASS